MLSELICITYGSSVCCKEILNFLLGTIPFSIKSPFFAMKSQTKIKHKVSTSGQVLASFQNRHIHVHGMKIDRQKIVAIKRS